MWWFLAVLAGIFLFLFLKKSWEENSQGVRLNDGTAAEDEALENIVEMEDIFFEAVKSGKKAVKFMHLFYQEDLMMIKSLFQSEHIPYRIENEHVASVLVGYGVTGFNHTDLYILREDYDDAFKIVKEYAENKQLSGTSSSMAEKAGAVITVLLASSFIPDKNETSGIVVFKLEED
ncbi:DUF2007 domain-containing protein [Treponema sp. OMZ 787]|uniref:putative signal transducing protein n=1 Tax=Treponema sp. OMZ 787 TaxID=2563669 RepID=UPI0020A3BCAB|nr:DUF2007 domain-containing protein [Treponema sp. OMZ 787]UTC61423.1 DUF2007 domain-containing protein [Treponema sp. OMZ 787]